MFAKGNLHGDGAKLVDYLLTGKDGERVAFGAARGFDFFSNDLRGAARLMDRMAGVISRAEKPWFHTQVRLPDDERLTRVQWEQVVEREEKVLGFTGQPRLWTMHIDEATGERHLHVVWHRIDVERERAIDPGLFKNKLQFEVARYLEKQLGLRRIGNERRPGDRARYADRHEVDESRRLNTDVRKIRNAVLDCFERSDNGRSFAAAIKAHGFELATGDRDNFVVIDQAGGHHALNKRLTGKTLVEIRDRLSDIDRAQLPTVEQAKTAQRRRRAARAARERGETRGRASGGGTANARTGGRQRAAQGPSKPLGKTATLIREAAGDENFVRGLAERGLKLVFVTPEEARASVFAQTINPLLRPLKEGFAVIDLRGNAYRIDRRTTGEKFPKVQAQLARLDKGVLATVAQARDQQREINRAQWRAKKQAERDAARPATATERKILGAAEIARNTQGNFHHELGKEGIGLARVTAADIAALERLRQKEAVSFAAGPAYQPKFFPQLEAGELVAVDSRGGVNKLNPQHLAAAGLELGDPNLPSVEIVRHAFAAARAAAASFQHTMIGIQLARRKEGARARKLRAVNRAEETSARSVDRAAGTTAATAERLVFKAARGGLSAAAAALGTVAKAIEGLFDFLSGPTAPPTKEEAQGMRRSAEERRAETADWAAQADYNDRLDDLLRQTAKDDAERLRQRRERGDNDEVDRGRERER